MWIDVHVYMCVYRTLYSRCHQRGKISQVQGQRKKGDPFSCVFFVYLLADGSS